jgi:hydrophobic/amphiphilic exporter-1 (mainly G- bacteria), HAE1 family
MLLKKGLVISGGFRARRAPSPAIRSAANEPNTGFIVPLLKPFADRTRAADMAQSLIGVFAEGQQIRSANVIAFNLPPIIGLSTTCAYRKPKPAHNGDEVRQG